MQYTRRDALKLGLFGSAALAIPLERAARADSVLDNRMPANNSRRRSRCRSASRRSPMPVSTDGDEDLYRIPMKVAKLEVLPGFQTTFWGYGGIVPGPTLMVDRRPQDQGPVRQRAAAEAPDARLHAVDLGAPARLAVAAAVRRLRERPHVPGPVQGLPLPEHPRATTHWYHDHGVHHTAENVWMGLAGQYHVHDDLERSLPIPHGEFDVPIIYGDRMFDKHGELLFTSDGHDGQFGDVILVNGVPWPLMKVKRRKYRFRLLNALGLARLQPVALERRPVHRDLHRRRADAGAAVRHEPAPHHGRAVRDRDRLREVQPGHAVRPQEHQPAEQHRVPEHRQDHGVRGHGRRRSTRPTTRSRRRCSPTTR